MKFSVSANLSVYRVAWVNEDEVMFLFDEQETQLAMLEAKSWPPRIWRQRG